MSNIVIATPALSDSASSITAGSEVAGFQVEKLQDKNMSDRWRTASLASVVNVDVDLGSVQVFNFVSLIGTNATASALVRVKGAVSNSSSAFDQGPELVTNGNPIASAGSWTHGDDWEIGYIFDASDSSIVASEYFYALDVTIDAGTLQPLILAGGYSDPNIYYYSTDGVTWAASSVPSVENVEAFVSDGIGTTIAACYNGELLRSYYPTTGYGSWDVLSSASATTPVFRDGSFNKTSGVWAFPDEVSTNVHYGTVASALVRKSHAGFTSMRGMETNDTDMFVACGTAGRVYYASADASTFASTPSNTTNNLRAVHYGNSIWVAVGENGTIIKSSDGLAWTSVTVSTTQHLQDVTYIKNQAKWVVVGNSGAVFESSDAITWTRKVGVASTLACTCIAYASNTRQAIIATSSAKIFRTFGATGAYHSALSSSLTPLSQSIAIEDGTSYTAVFKIVQPTFTGAYVEVGGNAGATSYLSSTITQQVSASTAGTVTMNALSSAAALFVESVSIYANDGAESYDSGWVSHWPEAGLSSLAETPFIHYTSVGASVRYVRIQIADSNNADGYYEAARLFISNAWEPAKNISYGWDLGWIDKSVQNETLNGNVLITPRSKFRVINFSLDFLDEDTMYNYAYPLDRDSGTSSDIMVVRDANSINHLQKQSIHGYMTELPAMVNPYFGIFRKRFRIRESI